jgi:hypothetical protein
MLDHVHNQLAVRARGLAEIPDHRADQTYLICVTGASGQAMEKNDAAGGHLACPERARLLLGENL